jgi:phytanoyl-CoA hydroxylase
MLADEPLFTLASDSQDVMRRYHDVGYVIFRDLIDHQLVDDVLDAIDKVKRNPLAIYYSQSVHRWVRPHLSPGRFMTESIENPSWHLNLPDLRNATMAVIYNKNVTDALHLISGRTHFVSWQDMLFDRSVGTVDHQDSWYLDTNPPGQLIAGWFSLEDIQPDSGPFFVFPKSHLLPRLSEADYPSHPDFIAKVRDQITESNLTKRPMLLPKGYVLFWHPTLVHGADFPADERYSRKSLTSHYYPKGVPRKDTVTLEDDLKMMKPTANERMFRKGVAEVPFILKGHMKWLRDALMRRTQPIIPMSRSYYR